MALSAKVGSFALAASTGNQSVTGVGFEPEIVLFFSTQNTADGVVVDQNMSVGAAISSTERMMTSFNDEDNVGTSDSTRAMSTTDILLHYRTGSEGVNVQVDFVSMDSDGFTINITSTEGSTWRVGYLALAGTDLTDVAIGKFTVSGSTGNQAVTGVGFQPDAIMTFALGDDEAAFGLSDVSWGMGFATGASEQALISVSSDNGQSTTNTYRAQSTSNCVGCLAAGSSAWDQLGSCSSLDSDGFTINWGTAAPSGDEVVYIAFKGGSYAVGSITSQTSTGNFSETGVGFSGSAGIFASFQNAASGSIQDGLKASVGIAESSTSRYVFGGVSEDAQATSDSDQYQNDALMYQSYDYSQGVEGAADFVSWNSDGFTLNQTDADPSGNEIIYFIIGATAVAPISATAADIIDMSDTNAKFATYPVSITEGLSMGESSGNIASLFGTTIDGLDASDILTTIASLRSSALDGLDASDIASTLATLYPTASDSLDGSDSSSVTATRYPVASDSIVATDNASIIATFSGVSNEVLTLSETLTTAALLMGLSADGFKVSEDVLGALSSVLQGLVTEGLVISDTSTVLAGLLAITSDGVSVSDTSALIATIQALSADGVDISDSDIISLLLLAATSDGLVASDTSGVSGQFIASALDIISASDIADVIATLLAVTGDSVVASDSNQGTLLLSVAVQDAMVLSDLSEGFIGLISALVTEGLVFSETGSVSATFDITVADTASFSEAVSTIMLLGATAIDSFVVSDISVHYESSGVVSIIFTVRQPGIDFNESAPGIALSERQGTITFVVRRASTTFSSSAPGVALTTRS